MILRMLFLSLVYLSNGLWAAQSAHPAYIDFDISMKTDIYAATIHTNRTFKYVGISGTVLLDFFRKLYVHNNPAHVACSSTVKIPKIIHQIWIGKQVPSEFRKFQLSWRLEHPGWEYKLWTQDDIAQLNLVNAAFVTQSRNPGEISDLMRYEILYRFGGVYVDFDQECLKSLEQLHYMYDFYIGIQPLDSGLVQLGIGIIGSIPGHPILKACIDRIKDTWYNKEYENQATMRTGPIHCTKVFYDTAVSDTHINVALPASYFYPLGCQEYSNKKKMWTDAGAFAVHHWAKSWLYPSFRRPEFMDIKNC